MQLVFWNTGRAKINLVIADILLETNAQLIGLAEYEDDPHELLRLIRSRGLSHSWVTVIACERIKILTSYPLYSLHHKRDADRYTAFELHLPHTPPLLIAMVHLPSKLHLGRDAQSLRAMLTRQEIEQVENACGHCNTIVVGDFNMNPFDPGMVGISSFNAIPCIRSIRGTGRKVAGHEFNFFYNPSWNMLGDRNEAAGTYYHKNPSEDSLYWNTLDQVVIRPHLYDRLAPASLKSLTSAVGQRLVDDRSVPAKSDHLPITFQLLEGVQV